MINSKITYTEKLDYYVRTQNLIPYRLHLGLDIEIIAFIGLLMRISGLE